MSMEIDALNVATAIVQFADYGTKLLSKAYKIYTA